MCYKGSYTACMVGSCRMIPPAHIAITSALLFSEPVTPLMLSVPRLLWPQHVNAHILHQSPSTTWHSILNWNHRQQHREGRSGRNYIVFHSVFQPHWSSHKHTNTNTVIICAWYTADKSSAWWQVICRLYTQNFKIIIKYGLHYYSFYAFTLMVASYHERYWPNREEQLGLGFMFEDTAT